MKSKPIHRRMVSPGRFAVLIWLSMLVLVSGCYDSAAKKQEEARAKEAAAAKAKRAAELAAAELDPDKQKAIWDGEHVTFEIEHLFGVALRDAIQKRDRDAVRALLRDDIASVALTSEFVKRSKGPVAEESRVIDESKHQTSDHVAIIHSLLAPMHRFQTVERSRFRVLEIERGDVPTHWTIKGLLTLVGRGESNALQFFESSHRIQFEIIDAKKMLEGPVVRHWKVLSETHRTCPQSLMEEVTDAAGLAKLGLTDNWTLTPEDVQGHRFHVAVADYNLDGYLDIAIGEFEGLPKLLISREGKTFADVTAFSGLSLRSKMDNYMASWIDYDNDGYPDLLMGNQLYHNEAGKRFKDVSQSSGLFFDKECMGAAIADYDADGRLDIYAIYQRHWASGPAVAEKWVGEEETGRANELWRNLGNGRFTKVAGAGGGKRHSHAAAWFYYDADHLPDLYVANDFGANVVLRNTGHGFEDVSKASGASDFATSMGVAAGDLNNDGVCEIYVANMYSKMGRRITGQVSEADYPPGIYEQIKGSCAGNRLYSRPDHDSRYQEYSTAAGVNEVGWAFGAAMADWNNDGLLDLYSTAGFLSFSRKKPDG